MSHAVSDPQEVDLLVADIGGTKIQIAHARVQHAGGSADGAASSTPFSCDIVPLQRLDTRAHEGGAAVAERVAEALALHARTLADSEICVRSVGIASAGVVNSEAGSIVSATDLMPGWGGTPLGAMVTAASGLPCALVGDVHGHALGEAYAGAGRGAASVLSCAVGTGMGGGFVDHGVLQQGAHGIAGHIGHMFHPAAAGLTCSCGRSGHIETIASGTGIARFHEARTGVSVAGGRELQEMAEAGDLAAQETFRLSAQALGHCLGSLANILDPAIIVVSGSMTRSGATWWENVHIGYLEHAMGGLADVPIVPAQRGDDAPLIGAAAWALGYGRSS